MKTARIIYNPTSGREIFRNSLPEVLEKFEKAGYITSTHATTKANDAVNAAKHACEIGVDLLVAAGGDGTVSEVINGMAQCEDKPALGVLPMGTVNDYATALGIDSDMFVAIDQLLNGVETSIDIGKMNDKYFMNIAGGGKITEISYEAPSRLKAIIGPFAYYIKGIELLPKMTASEVRIEYDGEVFEGKIMLFLLGLTNSIGGFDKLVPDPAFDDGYFSLFIIKEASIMELGHIMSLANKGDHLDHPKVEYHKAKEVIVEGRGDRVQLNLDGEYGGLLPAHFRNLQSFLKVVVPKHTYNKYFTQSKQSKT